MSLSRYYLNRVFDDIDDFDLRPRDLLYSRRPFSSSSIFQPSLRSGLSRLDHEKEAKIDKDGFQVLLDVQHFTPSEISVKTVDKEIVVEANHEERKDEQGFISRTFKRRYVLPEGYNSKDVVSTISSDGILTIKAPNPKAAEGDNVRNVQIQQTGPSKEQPKADETPKTS